MTESKQETQRVASNQLRLWLSAFAHLVTAYLQAEKHSPHLQHAE